MKCISWNCQGIGSTLTIRALKDLVRKYKPEMIFLMERRVGFEKAIYVDPVGLGGGLALWYNDVQIEVLEATRKL